MSKRRNADIQEGVKKPLYIDRVHYSSEMSNKLAAFIADLIVQRNLALKQYD